MAETGLGTQVVQVNVPSPQNLPIPTGLVSLVSLWQPGELDDWSDPELPPSDQAEGGDTPARVEVELVSAGSNGKAVRSAKRGKETHASAVESTELDGPVAQVSRALRSAAAWWAGIDLLNDQLSQGADPDSRKGTPIVVLASILPIVPTSRSSSAAAKEGQVAEGADSGAGVVQGTTGASARATAAEGLGGSELGGLTTAERARFVLLGTIGLATAIARWQRKSRTAGTATSVGSATVPSVPRGPSRFWGRRRESATPHAKLTIDRRSHLVHQSSSVRLEPHAVSPPVIRPRHLNNPR